MEMRKHLLYLRYLLRHKLFVFQAGLKTGAPIWRLIIHDWSKFLPSEWIPYVEKFYGRKPEEIAAEYEAKRRGIFAEMGYEKAVKQIEVDLKYTRDHNFNVAWLKHQHRNPHHWQHWVLAEDNPSKRLETPQTSGTPRAFPLPMPLNFVREMVADWAGAGRAISGKWELPDWYSKNRENIVLEDTTRAMVEALVFNTRWG